MEGDDSLMRPIEVARMFGVNTRTLARWAREGRLESVETLGGHRRYYREDVKRFLEKKRKDDVA